MEDLELIDDQIRMARQLGDVDRLGLATSKLLEHVRFLYARVDGARELAEKVDHRTLGMMNLGGDQ